MLEIAIPDYENELKWLDSIGNSGYFLGFGLRFGHPDYFLNRYPEPWTTIYESENFFFGDPVAVWTIARTGSMRWSDCPFPDPRNIMPQAAEHGLVYGATFVTKLGGKRSFLSIARDDRELTDEEMTSIMSKIEHWAMLFARAKVALTKAELETLKLLHNGLQQAEVAKALKVSVSTVKGRADSAQKKLGAKNTMSAVGQVVRMNLI